jgi:hypothetical protein
MIGDGGRGAVTTVNPARVQCATASPDDVVFVHADAADSCSGATA